MKNKIGSVLLMLAIITSALTFVGCEVYVGEKKPEGKPNKQEFVCPSELVGVWKNDECYAENSFGEYEHLILTMYLYSNGNMELYANGELQKTTKWGVEYTTEKNIPYFRTQEELYTGNYLYDIKDDGGFYEINDDSLVFDSTQGIFALFWNHGYLYELDKNGNYKKINPYFVKKFTRISWLY